MTFELKLSNGTRVIWDGDSGEDAARRYVDAHRESTVIAWRNTNRHGFFVIGRPDRVRIVESVP